MGQIRVAPSAIDAYLGEHGDRSAVDDEGIAWVYQVRIPARAGAAISPRLTPLIEVFLDATHKLALELLDEENKRRKPQSQYQLRNPRLEDYAEAALRISNDPLKYIFQDSFDKRGGEQRGETDPPPDERSDSNDPHGGDLE